LEHESGIIIPTDFHIFQRGWNHQSVMVEYVPLSKYPNSFKYKIIFTYFIIKIWFKLFYYQYVQFINNDL
jgi:hypothetical protein